LAALRLGLPVIQPEKIRAAEALSDLKSFEAEAAVVVAYGRILPEAFLSAFPRGCINVHFSLLPKYRGAAPVNWAIVNGETVTGVTTMQMDAGLDTGDILLQQEEPIASSENAIELIERLAILGADVLSKTLADLDAIVPREQDNTKASLAPILKKEDGRFDWSMAAAMIERRVRGFQPFPTTFTSVQSKKLTLWRAEIAEVQSDEVQPGTVLQASRDGLVIACGEGALRIIEIQTEGRRRMNVGDFLNGIKLKEGDLLN
jgi:methionyl-tRNA formyltransferase